MAPSLTAPAPRRQALSPAPRVRAQAQVAIVIPTYNNRATLGAVVDQALATGARVIVVDDGSTDGTAALLERLPIEHVRLPTNRGKGEALRQGLRHARALGFEWTLSIDADGQHDAPAAWTRLTDPLPQEPALLLGRRAGLDALPEVPARTQIGLALANRSVALLTGRRLHDSQTGVRLYPTSLLDDLGCRGERFELETEVIVRALWSGVPIEEREVPVHYPPARERVSHYRPLLDSLRILRLQLRLLGERSRLPK